MSTKTFDVEDSEVEALQNLSPALKRELENIEAHFDVGKDKLKEISRRFEEELREGLERHGSNIVRIPPQSSRFLYSHHTADERHLDFGLSERP